MTTAPTDAPPADLARASTRRFAEKPVRDAVPQAGRAADDEVHRIELDDAAEVVDCGNALDVEIRLDRVLELLGVLVVVEAPDPVEDRARDVALQLVVVPRNAFGNLLRVVALAPRQP